MNTLYQHGVKKISIREVNIPTNPVTIEITLYGEGGQPDLEINAFGPESSQGPIEMSIALASLLIIGDTILDPKKQLPGPAPEPASEAGLP